MIFSCIPKLNSCKVVCFFGKIEIVLMYECQTLCFVVIGRGLSITLTASDNKQNHMLITSWYLMISRVRPYQKLFMFINVRERFFFNT